MNTEIAETIMQQIRSNRLGMMIGVTQWVALENGLTFKFKAGTVANYCKITLNGLDLYDMEIGKIRGTTYKVVDSSNDLYNDMLMSNFESVTGLATHL